VVAEKTANILGDYFFCRTWYMGTNKPSTGL